MPHTIKVDDKTYDRLKAYCDLNNVSPHDIARSAIEVYLNDLMYGDAPFMITSNKIDERHHDKDGQIVVTPISAKDGEKELTKILMENQDPPLTEEQKEKQKKFIEEETKNLKEFIEAEPVKRPTKRRL